ncbi:type VI secretion system-associated FHA domain protein [Xenorhabdus sp. PB30.3]|uniref:type VI secretion system-associated FHA domain protein n=1 Tax=Xenorhabdus sp. PB30.3 TaxID=2788941 RepID=UPI001E4D02AA|nr:type VI secretion system-associated FHA domain protein [Xenorhabdus sp. PB30.3]MCC8378260.1 FHA domain-containing protein [Xenorhabdus sp. PB30.3]
MRFTIVKNNSTSQPTQLSYEFSPPGGTIGHCKDNSWILPDAEQGIARVQAIVSINTDGKCRITNLGSATELLLNTIPVAPNRQVEIRDGDVLNIGSYQIQVIDPYQNAQLQTDISATSVSSESDTQGIPSEVWDGLEKIFTIPDTPTSSDKHQASSDGNDHNPLFPSSQQENDERNPIDPLAKIKTTADLDTLQLRAKDPVTMFNSDPLFRQEDILNDNTPTTLFQNDKEYDFEHNDKEGEIDPLALFSDQNVKQKQNTKNQDPLDLMLGTAAPLTSPDHPKIAEPKSASVTQSASDHNTQSEAQLSPLPPLFTTEELSREINQDLVTNQFSTETEETMGEDTVFNPPNKQTDQSHQPYIDQQIKQLSTPPHISNDDPIYERLNIDPISYKSDEHVTEGVKLEGKLLAALLEGMGLKNLRQPQFDEHRMYQLGQLISQLSQGLVALNTSRTLLKREAEAEITQMLSDTNNPFKLLPSGQSVLVQMFGDHMPGFMSIEQATRDILIELQAHQLGMIAGMRAITVDILQLFHPTILEQKARDEGGMPRLSLSSTYKASLWEFLTKHYQKTASEFEHNSGLFGKNFLLAYENEVNNYKNSQKKIKKQTG